MNGLKRLALIITMLLGMVGLFAQSGVAMAQVSLPPLYVERYTKINTSGSHNMFTTATLQRSGPLAGQLDATTRTRSDVLFAGFTGGVAIVLKDANGATIGGTALHTFGVDGKWTGLRSDRTDRWQERFDPQVAAATARLEIIQIHAPKGIAAVVHGWVEQARKLCRVLPPFVRPSYCSVVLP